MFDVVPTEQERFQSFDDLLTFVASEKKRITRIPLRGLWESGARFRNDAAFGLGETEFRINHEGLEALCAYVGIDPRILERLEEEELATDVLNDLLGSRIQNLGPKSAPELVVDESGGNIIGIVSSRYVGYSNDSFIGDVLHTLSGRRDRELFPDLGDLKFREAFSINSRLHLRLVSKSIQGRVSGRGGTGEDVSEIGVEMRNSMAGGQAVRLSWFIYRLICANGLVARAGGREGRVVHSGTEEAFRKKLDAETAGLVGSLKTAAAMVKTLGGLPFDPVKLAKHAEPRMVFGIIAERELQAEAKAKAGLKPSLYEKLTSEARTARREADTIAELPFCLGGEEALAVFKSGWRDGASMYDFINVFTEYAKSRPLSEKAGIETKAGELASWIAKNKRKFS